MVDARQERRLGGALRSVAETIEYGTEPDLVPAIRASLMSRAHARSARYVRLSLAVAVAIAVGAIVVGAFSPARRAVARALGIGGVEIRFSATPPPTPTVSPGAGSNLFLGRQTTLDAAIRSVDFAVAVPDGTPAGSPDRVYLSTIPAGGRVSLVYEPSPFLPEARETGLGMLITEFRSDIVPDFVKKLISSGATVTETSVDGSPGYWIQGAHFYMYKDRFGGIRQDTLRVSSNALVWERDGATYRIESALSKNRALAIARSM